MVKKTENVIAAISGKLLIDWYPDTIPDLINYHGQHCVHWEGQNHVNGGRERVKHSDILKHFAHEAVQNGHMRVCKIPTEFQLADLLTKVLQLLSA